MRDPARVRVTGPLAPYAAGFEQELARLGYTPGSACRVLNLMAHASRWLAGRGLGVDDLGPVQVDEFFRERRRDGYVGHLSPKAMAVLIDHLGRLGVIGTNPCPRPPSAVDEVLERYAGYLVTERGVAPATVRSYIRIARQFLSTRSSASGLHLERLTTADVAGFVSAECPRLATASAKSLTTGLRSLLRFLHVDGVTSTGLAQAVPGAAGWRLASLPKAVDRATVTRLLASCDRHSPVGARDFAVLVLLSRLGLRAGEVSLLELTDIDWRSGEVSVRGKGNRHERLPLPVEVGEAVVDWLRQRPRCACSTVFTTVRAPHRRLSGAGVSAIVRQACRRCGVEPLGAHRLRHTVATELLRAGAGLGEIGLVLRHRRLATTAVYAKVDRLRLATLAQPWPGGAA
jgi:integrase/recombinase XerD